MHRVSVQPQGIISGAGGQQARLRSVDDVVTLRMTWVELQVCSSACEKEAP